MPDTTAVPTENVLILSCPDQRGIVATVTALLFEHGANIEESQQFYDERTDQFFMRIRFSVEAGGPSTAAGAGCSRRWRRPTAWSGRSVTPRRPTGPCHGEPVRALPQRPALPLEVGALNLDIPAVVSNHRDLEPLVASYGIPFHHLPSPPRPSRRPRRPCGHSWASTTSTSWCSRATCRC